MMGRNIGKAECIDEINDLLDSLNSIECIRIMKKLTYSDLITLKCAIEEAIKDAITSERNKDKE